MTPLTQERVALDAKSLAMTIAYSLPRLEPYDDETMGDYVQRCVAQIQLAAALAKTNPDVINVIAQS